MSNLLPESMLAEIRARAEAVPMEPPFSHGAFAIADRRKLLAHIEACSSGGASEQHQQALDRACYVIMELMQAYERRIRSDCTTPEQLAANPWECAEYIKAERFLKAIWKDGRAQPFAALDEFLGYLRTAPEPEAEPMKGSKVWQEIQGLRGYNARLRIEMDIIDRLLDGTADDDLTSIDMEYWIPVHDRIRALVRNSSPEPVAKPNPCRNECSLISLDDDHWKCNHCDAVFAYTGAQKPVEKPRCWWPLCKETAGDALCDAVQSALTKGEKP